MATSKFITDKEQEDINKENTPDLQLTPDKVQASLGDKLPAVQDLSKTGGISSADLQEQVDTGTFSKKIESDLQDFTPDEVTPTPDVGITEDTSKADIPEVDVPAPAPTPTPTGTTGIEEVDVELDKLKEEKALKIQEAKDSFELARQGIEENKEFYTNFDIINDKFNGVNQALEQALADGVDLDNEDRLRNIASQFGLTIEEVKDPDLIFDRLNFTPEGEEKFGIDDAQSQIDRMQTDFDRQNEDLDLQLDQTLQNLNNQLEDVERQLKNTLDFGTAQGAFAGSFKSSGFTQGLANIKEDGERTIARLKELKAKANRTTGKAKARLLEDFNNGVVRAKEDFDKQIEGLKSDTGIAMNLNVAKYDIGSDDLSKILDGIKSDYVTKDLDIRSKYLDTVKKAQDITNDNIDRQNKLNDLVDKKADKRFQQIIANDGQLLSGMDVQSLINSVNTGELSAQRAGDLLDLMKRSINSTLSKKGLVSEMDLKTIDKLLNQGKTPSQIVAQLQGLDKFQDQPDTGKVQRIDLGGGRIRVTQPDGTVEEFLDGKPVISPTTDLSTNEELIDKYPNEAAFKNNNPTGITFRFKNGGTLQKRTLDLMKEDGIQFEEGTNRPEREGGTYMKFATIDDGLRAHNILLTKMEDDIESRLKRWKGEGTDAEMQAYADSIMASAGIPKGTKFSQLNDDTLRVLLAEHIKRESPNYFKEVVNKAVEEQGVEPPKDNLEAKVLGLTAGLPGTVGERSTMGRAMVDLAREKGISLVDAKKELGFKSDDDRDFIKTRGGDIKDASKSLREKTSSARTTLTLLNNPSTAIGDVASVVGFLKTIDPTSVARESEVAAVENARGALESLSNTFNKLSTGKKLVDSQREDLKNAITTIVNAADARHLDFIKEINEEFNDRGLDASVFISKDMLNKIKEPKPLTPEEIQIEKQKTKEQSLQALKGLGFTPGTSEETQIDSYYN